MWNIWKERNRRVFKNQSMVLEQIWTTLHQNIMESLSTKEWYLEDMPTSQQEKAIWENWRIPINQQSITKKKTSVQNKEADKWTPPPNNMFQLNFDGASKGNPGKAGYGGVFRDHHGNPQLIYMGSKGWDTNNSAELEGVWRGLILAQERGFFPLIIEGDSQIIIRMITKLMNGSHIHKVSNSWRMAQMLDLINKWLSQHQAISLRHIKREGNKLADFLANLGVEIGVQQFEGTISNIASVEQISKFQEIVTQDKSQGKEAHPDAGVIQVL